MRRTPIRKIYFTVSLSGTDHDYQTVEWEVVSGGGTLDATETTLDQGLSTVGLDITSAAVGAMHKVSVRLTSLDPEESELSASSADVETFPGYPATMTVTKNKTSFWNDGTDTIEFEARFSTRMVIRCWMEQSWIGKWREHMQRDGEGHA
ncbi:MAG: hypothetical protein M3463_04380 [Verrucomicrobiota bacterium]|nr:hypothetical protein [Verrucomicrobiota bacterium]